MRALVVAVVVLVTLAAAPPVSAYFGVRGSWGSFENAVGVATDIQGNVYVVDSALNRVQKFGPSGELLLGFPVLDFASAIAVDSKGVVYVVREFADRVERFSPAGDYLGEWNVESPQAIAADSSGAMYVANGGGEPGIEKRDPSGAVLVKWNVLAHSGLAIDRDGNVYASSIETKEVWKFSPLGGLTQRIKGHFGPLYGPSTLAVDTRGHLWVGDWSNSRIQEFDAKGRFVSTCRRGIRGTGHLAAGPDGSLYLSQVDHVLRLGEVRAPGSPCDDTAPRLSANRISRRSGSARLLRRARVRFSLSEPARLRWRLVRIGKSHRQALATVRGRRAAGPGSATPLRRVPLRKLPPGRYMLVTHATDPAGNRSKPGAIRLRVRSPH